MCVHAKSLSRVGLTVILWTIACQAPLSLGFSRQEYWSGLLVPSSKGSSWPRDRTSISYISGRFFMAETPEKPASYFGTISQMNSRQLCLSTMSLYLSWGWNFGLQVFFWVQWSLEQDRLDTYVFYPSTGLFLLPFVILPQLTPTFSFNQNICLES